MPRPLPPDQRRALLLLAGSGREGMTEGLLAAHGIPVVTVADLVKAGLATAHAERLGRPRITRTVVTITDKGREVISRAAGRA